MQLIEQRNDDEWKRSPLQTKSPKHSTERRQNTQRERDESHSAAPKTTGTGFSRNSERDDYYDNMAAADDSAAQILCVRSRCRNNIYSTVAHSTRLRGVMDNLKEMAV